MPDPIPATNPSFVHLRVHTIYSLSEGAIRITELAKLCRSLKMPAVAMTDTNNLFGAMEFSLTLADAGIQPILGCQLNLADDGREGRGFAGAGRTRRQPEPVVALVQNETGYGNLLALIERLYRDAGGPDGPCVGVDDLAAHGEGLILLTGGAAGPLGQRLREGRGEVAQALLARLREAYRDRLYVEIQRHGMADERAVENGLLDLAERFSLPIVATNEAFFAAPDMYEAHDALLCIAQGVAVAEPERRRLTPEHYFKSAAEMGVLFADLPDALANSVLIARRCAFALKPRKPMLPAFNGGDGCAGGEEAALRAQAEAGLDKRLATARGRRHDDAAYRERLDYELGVICQMGFAGYFLIVAEFITWAKARGIPVGPGRGSGAGSVVAWSLGITDLDPLRFGLLFERFLNPERVSMPDFDIDFCQDRRDEVIAHVQERYGADRVAQIITFGKLQARAVLRDVGRVLGMSYGYVDKICKLVPFNPAHPPTLDEAIAAEPQLRAMMEADEAVARLIGIGRQLEGLYRHASTHAAGVVIAGKPLSELIPVYRDPRSALLVSGFNMKSVEEAGLVKFDFLGLKTLSVLAHAVALIRDGRGIDLDLANLPLDDGPTFAMLGRGETTGVFQLESAGMRDAIRRLKPDTLEDIIAVVALFRPGPMDNIPSYTKRKHGEEEPDYLHPMLKDILAETYGIIIYQEQVMQIAQTLSGYSLGGADLLRRAMGKKIQSEMDRQRATFVEGAVGRGVEEAKARQIFELVNKFAGYGFNKSHAAAYALIAYQTAYLKANFPLEFFAASMTLDLGNPDKLNVYRQELTRRGIALLPPDINASAADFRVEPGSAQGSGAGAIRYGLAAVKNVGAATIAAIVAERDRGGRFTSIADFCARVHDRHLNKRQLENLIRAGAFDGLERNRKRLFENADVLIRAAGAAAQARSSAQIGLFGGGDGGSGVGGGDQHPALPLAEVEDWPPIERLRQELDAVGFYLSAHPLDAYAGRLKRLRVKRFAEVLAERDSGEVTLAGTVVGKAERTSGKGTRYAHLQLSDASGLFEVTVFSELLASCRELLTVGTSLLIGAEVRHEGESVRGLARTIEALETAMARVPATLQIAVENADALPGIRRILDEHRGGRGSVRLISCLENGVEVEIALPLKCRLGPEMAFALKALPGVREVEEA